MSQETAPRSHKHGGAMQAPSATTSAYIPPPVLSTSFKGVLQIPIRDYRTIKMSELNLSKFYLYMPASTFVVRCLQHPFNVIKTRMQTSGGHAPPGPDTGLHYPSTVSPYHSAGQHAKPASSAPRILPYRPLPVDLSKKTVWQAFTHILHYEGFRGLYAGYGVSVLGLIVGPIYLTSLEATRETLYRAGTLDRLPVDLVPACAGFSASCVANILGVPIDVISNRQMKDGSRGPRQGQRGAWTIAKDVYRKQGPLGFYKGYFLTLMHNAPMSSIVWFTFAQLHPRLGALTQKIGELASSSGAKADAQRPPTAASSSSSSSDAGRVFDPADPSTHHLLPPAGREKWHWPELGVVCVSAALSGGFASMVTLPLDVLKTRLQTSSLAHKSSIRSTFRDLYRERGWQGFFAGARPRLFSSAGTSASLMTLYEILKRVCVVEPPVAPHKHLHQ